MENGNGKNIFQALAAVNAKVEAIGKTRNNVQQNFKFRGIDDVMNALHGAMAAEGVFILTEPIGETERSERTTSKGGLLFHLLQRWNFTFCAPDGSSVSASFVGEAMDSGDKGMNKSASVALKYVLLQMFLIPTIEQAAADPDGQGYDLRNDRAEALQQMNEELQGVISDCKTRCAAFKTEAEFKALRVELEKRYLSPSRPNLPDGLKDVLRAAFSAFQVRQQQEQEQQQGAAQ